MTYENVRLKRRAGQGWGKAVEAVQPLDAIDRMDGTRLLDLNFTEAEVARTSAQDVRRQYPGARSRQAA